MNTPLTTPFPIVIVTDTLAVTDILFVLRYQDIPVSSIVFASLVELFEQNLIELPLWSP
ncbi:MAG: hypothetical protein HY862_13830 [Chloroflexi bacterium]|nr:hypothetical protein [Chloroflexota bacterium]